MLHLIPPPLHRMAYRAAHGLRKIWWRWRGPMIHGVSVIARREDGAVLLIRASYGSQLWQLPGGGVALGEDPCRAALREFREETGLELRDPCLLGQQVENLHGAINIAHIVAGHATGEAQADGREIIAAQWYPPDALPAERSAALDRRLTKL